MSKVYKIAGQASPAANTDTVLFTVPTGKEFVAATLAVVNRATTGAPIDVRVAIVPSGETLSDKHYIEYGLLLDIREGKRIGINLGMDAGTRVYVHSSSANASFTLGGVVIDK